MLRDLILALRPRQWVKNLVILAPLVFSARLFDEQALMAAAVALVFCLLSGSVYLFNDIIDRDQDRRHPVKRHRPIAAGRLPISTAAWTAGGLAFACIATGLLMHRLIGVLVLAYVGYNILYSLFLKQFFIVDVLIIASGFVIRLMAGGVIIGVSIPQWMLWATFCLALFLGLGKRRAALMTHPTGVAMIRPVLGQYRAALLDPLLLALLTITVFAYCLYIVSGAAGHSQSGHLLYTVPFVVYGLLRYLSVLQARGNAEEPSDFLYTDRPLQGCVLLWGIAVVGMIYSH